MIALKKLLFPALTAGFAVMGMLATTSAASAYVACNREGDCWHTERRVHAPGVVLEYHPDDWYFHQHWDDHHHFREFHDGRGYWRGGVWITL